MSLAEKIDNSKLNMNKGSWERLQKRKAHRHSRGKAKRMLQNEEEPPNEEGKYSGWTT